MTDKHYVLIESPATLSEAILHLETHTLIAYDTETTGLNVRKDKVIGLSFTGEIGVGYYYPIWYWNKDMHSLMQYPTFKQEDLNRLMLLVKQRELIMHNGSYDVRITANSLKVNLLNALHADTVLMEHTLNEEGPFGLKEICIALASDLRLDDQDAANQEQLELKESVIRNGGSWTLKNKEIYKGDLEILSKYACADVDMTLRLYQNNLKRLHKENLYNLFFTDEVMPLYKYVTIRMESRGVRIDMEKLNTLYGEIQIELHKLESEVVEAISSIPEWDSFITDCLNEEYSVSSKGSFAQELCRWVELPLPLTKKGKFSINKKTLKAVTDPMSVDQFNALNFLNTGEVLNLSSTLIRQVQENLYKKANETSYLINIQSKTQLGKLVFDYMKLTPLSKTDKGTPQFNEDFVESIFESHKWAESLRLYNKLTKIKSSYYERFLTHCEDGIYYPSFKQHGTSSGRYSSDFQQLPRPKDEDSTEHELILKYSDAIRELVISHIGYVFIDDDYESLEPRCFADDAGDDALIKIFTDNLDMYSVVAIAAEGIKDASADKKSLNFLKKKYPQRRQNAKAYALGIRYGMKAYKLSKTLNISVEQADEIIHNYFTSFPGLKKKMDQYLHEVKTTGKVTSKFGRVRHLPRAKEIYAKFGDAILEFNNLKRISMKTYIPMEELKAIRKEYNNLLNNALNFPIQSAATSIVNRAAIAMTKRFIDEKLDAWVSLQIHDQLVISCNKDCIDRVKEIVQDSMENTNKLLMPLVAKPEVAYNLRDGH